MYSVERDKQSAGEEMFKIVRVALPIFIAATSIFTPKVSFSQTSEIPPSQLVLSFASCLGIGTPVTKDRLQAIGKAIKDRGGILVVSEGNVENVEYAFELFSLTSMVVVPYNLPEYSEAKKGLVYPDGIWDVQVELRQVIDGTSTVIYERIWEESAFYEAKTTQGILNPQSGSSRNQVLGLIDVTSNNTDAGTFGQNEPLHLRPLPQLVFLTVQDTIISDLTRNVATDFRVALYQSFLCERSNGSLGIDMLQMGVAVPLNAPDVYVPGQPIPLPIPAGNPGSIGSFLLGENPPEDPYDDCRWHSSGYWDCPVSNHLPINEDVSELELEHNFDILFANLRSHAKSITDYDLS